MADGITYRVVWSSSVRETILDLARKARDVGKGGELANDLKTLGQRLSHEPLLVGEVYRARSPVAEFLAIQGMLAVDFAVDKQKRLVLVRKCQVMSGHGF